MDGTRIFSTVAYWLHRTALLGVEGTIQRSKLQKVGPSWRLAVADSDREQLTEVRTINLENRCKHAVEVR